MSEKQTEMQEMTGKGKFFTIDGKQYEVTPATLGQLEEVADKWNDKVHPVIVANFLKANQESREELFNLLDMAFDGKLPREEMKKMDRVQVREALDFFLVE